MSAKLDFLMPTLSFKDRGAVMLAELARRLAPGRVVADSSGNAGASRRVLRPGGTAVHVYVPEGTSRKKTEQMPRTGPPRLVPGGPRGRRRPPAAAADEPGAFYASHVYNPYFLHGTKTYVYELWEELGGRLPQALVVPVGNGTLLLGRALAVAELSAHGLRGRPALIAVQAEAVAPLADAFAPVPRTCGPAPSGGRPWPRGSPSRPPRARQILGAVRATGGTFLTVPDDGRSPRAADLARRGLSWSPRPRPAGRRWARTRPAIPCGGGPRSCRCAAPAADPA